MVAENLSEISQIYIPLANPQMVEDTVKKYFHMPFPQTSKFNFDMPIFFINNSEKKAKNKINYLLDFNKKYKTFNIRSWADQFREIVHEYSKRISVLEEQAEFDEISPNPASKEALFDFIMKNPFIKRGRLVLMENGNFRAVWRNSDGDQLGLQFLGKDSVQYVIFKHRQSSSQVSRVFGRDTMNGIIKQIDAFALNGVLYDDWQQLATR